MTDRLQDIADRAELDSIRRLKQFDTFRQMAGEAARRADAHWRLDAALRGEASPSMGYVTRLVGSHGRAR